MRLRVAVAGSEGLITVQEWLDNRSVPVDVEGWHPAGLYSLTVVFNETGVGQAHVEMMMGIDTHNQGDGGYIPWHQDPGMLEVEQRFGRYWIGGQGTEDSVTDNNSGVGSVIPQAEFELLMRSCGIEI